MNLWSWGKTRDIEFKKQIGAKVIPEPFLVSCVWGQGDNLPYTSSPLKWGHWYLPYMDVVKGDNAYLQIIVDIKENIMYIYYAFHSLFTMLYIYYNFSYACYKGQDFNQTNSRLTSGGIVYRKQWLNGCRHGCKEQHSCWRQNGNSVRVVGPSQGWQ